MKVSICCLTHNHEKYIKDCLGGFLMQKTNFDFEILIHDDASTDRTQEIIKEYEEKHPSLIKPIYQVENQFSKGIKPTWTFNYPRAQGEFIALCEGDDYWTDPLKLQKQVDFLEGNEGYVLSTHDSQIIFDDIQRYETQFRFNLSTFELNDIIGSHPFATASMLFRNILIHDDYFFLRNSKSFSSDKLLIGLLLSKGKGSFFKESMCVYRRNPGGLSTKKKWSEATQSSIDAVTELQNYLKKGKSPTITHRLMLLYGKLYVFKRNEKDYKGAFKALYKSIVRIRKWDDVKLIIHDFIFYGKKTQLYKVINN